MIMLTKKVRDNQKGIASFMVTFIICIVITLIVIGFGTISRREQRQALDEQLSSQAFYAAESKINQLYAQLKANPSSFSADDKCNPATTSTDPTNPPDNTVGLTGGISITCALATVGGSSTFDLAPDQSVTVPLNYKVGAADGSFSKIRFSWTSSSDTNCRTTNAFPSKEDLTNQLGTIRLFLTRADSTSGFNRSALANNTLSAVLYPGVRPTPTLKYPNPPYIMPNDYFGTYPTYSYSSGFSSTTRNGFGYTADEYKKFQAILTSNPAATQMAAYSAPSYGPSGSGGPTAGVSWLPFWNWLIDYQAKYGASSKPAARTTNIFGQPTAGNYDIINGDSTAGDNVPQYFQEWAKAVLNANPVGSYVDKNGNKYYVNNDPANRDTSDPKIQSVAFQTGTTGTVNNPVFFGYCTSGSPATANAEVTFSSPLPTNLQATLHNLFKNSRLTITGYDQSGAQVLTQSTGSSTGGGHATLDVTAKAQDVVRRIQVDVGYGLASGALNYPAQALRTSNSICKLLSITPSGVMEDVCP